MCSVLFDIAKFAVERFVATGRVDMSVDLAFVRTTVAAGVFNAPTLLFG